MKYFLLCKKCGNEFSSNSKIWRCSSCGGLIDIVIDIKSVKIDNYYNKTDSILKYRFLLPVDEDRNIVTFNEYFTPINTINDNNFGEIYLKSDYLFTTGSFKDRGALTLISKIKELGVDEIVEDSSGNAGTAIATYSAYAGIKCEIFLSSSTSKAKISQIENTGAKVIIIDGNRDILSQKTLMRAERLYYASHSWNPYFFHGTKTVAYEIYEQFKNVLPDTIFVPAGNGTLLIGLYIGFKELAELRLIDKFPRLVAVQTKSCSPLFNKWSNIDNEVEFNSVADGIAVGSPVRIDDMLSAVRSTGGFVISVTDDEIFYAYNQLLKRGFFVEPTAAVGLAGVYKSVSIIKPLVILTGHGLKKPYL